MGGWPWRVGFPPQKDPPRRAAPLRHPPRRPRRRAALGRPAGALLRLPPGGPAPRLAAALWGRLGSQGHLPPPASLCTLALCLRAPRAALLCAGPSPTPDPPCGSRPCAAPQTRASISRSPPAQILPFGSARAARASQGGARPARRRRAAPTHTAAASERPKGALGGAADPSNLGVASGSA
ncbi:MAG: hypothetical protein J3K34DRAFT_428543 [Monoraphidium minutum]|nr:MAG: hypothetical protein J3K34DRAFT_428543 [Monoraphidium minutum]